MLNGVVQLLPAANPRRYAEQAAERSMRSPMCAADEVKTIAGDTSVCWWWSVWLSARR
jgi:hypothetical protein